MIINDSNKLRIIGLYLLANRMAHEVLTHQPFLIASEFVFLHSTLRCLFLNDSSLMIQVELIKQTMELTEKIKWQ